MSQPVVDDDDNAGIPASPTPSPPPRMRAVPPKSLKRLRDTLTKEDLQLADAFEAYTQREAERKLLKLVEAAVPNGPDVTTFCREKLEFDRTRAELTKQNEFYKDELQRLQAQADKVLQENIRMKRVLRLCLKQWPDETKGFFKLVSNAPKAGASPNDNASGGQGTGNVALQGPALELTGGADAVAVDAPAAETQTA